MLVVLYRAIWLVPGNFPGRHQWARLWYQDTWMDHNIHRYIHAACHEASCIKYCSCTISYIIYTYTHQRPGRFGGLDAYAPRERPFAIQDSKRPTNQGRFALSVAYLATCKGKSAYCHVHLNISVPGTTVPGTPAKTYCIQTACQRTKYLN